MKKSSSSSLLLATFSMQTIALNTQHNKQLILAACQQLSTMTTSEQCALMATPEMSLSGYGCEDMFLHAHFIDDCWQQLLTICQQLPNNIYVTVGVPFAWQGQLYNCVALLGEKKVLSLTPKQFLANGGLYYEARWFQPVAANFFTEVNYCEHHFPMGQVLCDIPHQTKDKAVIVPPLVIIERAATHLRCAIEICEDAWQPWQKRPAYRYLQQQATVILNSSASHFTFDKQAQRRKLADSVMVDKGNYYLYANLLGNEAGRVCYDGGSFISCRDNTYSQPNCSFHTGLLLTLTAQKNKALPVATISYLAYLGAHWQTKPASSLEVNDDSTSAEQLFLQFQRVVALSLWDYMRKSKSHGFILSLSGGADSACCAQMIKLMVFFALADLGSKGVLRQLNYMTLSTEPQEWLQQLLTCVYQGSINSSEQTEHAAKSLAEDIGATYYYWQIEEQVQQYCQQVATSLETDLNWQQHDIALQNIQARVRAPGVWMLANIKKALLVTTSNRSEAAVGYATIDGDTAGSIAPIAGIDKQFILDWLQWAAQQAKQPEQKLPFAPSLALIAATKPTAELRPSNYKQTDEQDLMPYAVLNTIEKLFLIQRLSPQQIQQQIQIDYPMYDSQQIKQWVTKFFRLWSVNQWKRERYAPSFHIAQHSLDPKGWCRFPILSQFDTSYKLD